jgi:hypothetical protein
MPGQSCLWVQPRQYCRRLDIAAAGDEMCDETTLLDLEDSPRGEHCSIASK